MAVRYGDISDVAERAQAAAVMASGHVLAVDNYSVWALWLDAGIPEAVQLVERAKGRDGRPFGLTLANEIFLQYVDFDRICPEDRILFSDVDKLTRRLGAIAFLRLPGKQLALNDLPDRVWSRDEAGKPVIQNWSPEGKHDIHDLLVQAGRRGVRYGGVTSLNRTGKPEATTAAAARKFISGCQDDVQQALMAVQDYRTNRRITGSFPVIEASKEHGLTLQRSRAGGIGAILISRLLAGHPINIPGLNEQNHFGAEISELGGLQGPELRSGLLELLGWSSAGPTS